MTENLFSGLTKSKYSLLLFLWIALTFINVNKAFHIDDTFHLKAAEYLVNHPDEPMSGIINWGDKPSPMYSYNQPPLFFYLIAIVIKLFGPNEIVLHLLLSIFTFLALFFFQKAAELLPIKNKKLLLFLFAFNAAFIVNQNLMIDIPILAIVLGVFYFLLKAKRTKKYNDYIAAALLTGIGLLTKYSVFPLLVILPMTILINRDYKKLFVILIPLGILFLWSLWNYYEFGNTYFTKRK